MGTTVKVAIFEDHQSIIDGYIFRLEKKEGIKIVGSCLFGEELKPMLAETEVDVLLLDLSVPISADNQNIYPVRHELSKIVPEYPDLKIIAISVFDQPALVRSLVDIGIRGYILKDDQHSIQNLAHIIRVVADGGTYLSDKLTSSIFGNDPGIPLTPRQLDALTLCVAYPDLPTSALAQKMGITGSTFRNLLSEAYQRLGVRTKAAAVKLIQEKELIVIESGKYKRNID